MLKKGHLMKAEQLHTYASVLIVVLISALLTWASHLSDRIGTLEMNVIKRVELERNEDGMKDRMLRLEQKLYTIAKEK